MNAQQVNADITALLKARHSLLWITSREEVRVERALVEACAAARYPVRFWDCATGISDENGNTIDRNTQDPSAMLDLIANRQERAVYVLRDMHKWFDPVTLRKLRSLARMLQTVDPKVTRAIVLLTPSGEVPPELASATVIEYPLPDRAEVARILDDVIGALPEELRASAAPNGTRDRAIDSAVGLTAEEIANCYAKSLVSSRKVDPALVANEKRRVIARERVLTWYDPDPRGLDAIGGLDLLKTWLTQRRAAFSPKAREFGLPAPKGALLVGVPGCGKSLTAKAISAAWEMPLLRLDMGALLSKFLGESQTNIRKALAVAEAVSPCVLWLDEIEKALAGSTGEQGDGGVAADALGVILNWMQERQGSVFVIATSNDVRNLPPELLRKGRFDELFWVDLPTTTERAAILAASLKQHGRSADGIDLERLAIATDGFTGSEIAAIVPDALFVAFSDGARELTTEDLRAAAATVAPLSKTAAERIEGLRQWARGRARPASTPEQTASGNARALDL